MHYSIRTFIAADGDKMAILVNDEGGPFFWANVFVNSQYRNTGRSHNTCIKVLRSLGMLYIWASTQPTIKDLDQRLTSGDFLNTDEIDQLALFLRCNAESQKAHFFKDSHRNYRNIISAEKIRNGGKNKSKSITTANAYEAATRIRWVAMYLEYHKSRRVSKLDISESTQYKFKMVAEITIDYLRSMTPRIRPAGDDENLEGIDKGIVAKIKQALTPESSNNPFNSDFIKNRNILIWLFFYDTGARRDEIRNIKVDDIDRITCHTRIKISKTIPRTVPHSAELSNRFHSYILNYWSKLPLSSRKKGYLFTTEKGAHLSNQSINKIFKTIREKIPETPIFFTPHSMRRTWNDRFSEMIDSSKNKISSEQEQQMRNRLMGWSDNSRESIRYAKRHIRKSSDLLAENLANNPW